MNLTSQRLAQLLTTNIGNRVQRQTVIQLMMIQKVLPDTVHNQMEQLMLLMQEERHGQVPDLLLRVFRRRDEIHRFKMTKIDIVALDVDVKQLAHVFLFLVAIQVGGLEFLSDVGQLLIHTLLFQFSRSRISQVGDELD